MSGLVSWIYGKLNINSDRTKNITKHVLLSFLYKGGSILSSFLLVPLTINYLDTENYGIWLTLSSFIAWFSFFDIGLGNGLRNKLAIAITNKNKQLAKAYVSSAYFTIGIFSLVAIFFFIIINIFTDWAKVFNTSSSMNSSLNILMPIVFSFFCLQLVVKLITTVYIADQKHSVQGKVTFLTNVSSLFLIWLLTEISQSSLLLFGIVFSILPVFILLIFNFIGFNSNYKQYSPSISLWKKKYLKDIFGLGLKFFLIQIAGIVLFSTDNLIITQLYSPDKVVPYNIAFKYFAISNMLLSIVLAPYWSSITEAYTKGDYLWIKQSMRNLVKISVLSILGLVIMVFISSIVYDFWIGEKVHIPYKLTLLMAAFFAIQIFYSPFTYFINGTGKIKLQLISLITMAIVNVPLSFFLSKKLNFGISGVILATIICILPHLILCPIQYLKIINRRANGIWNQ